MRMKLYPCNKYEKITPQINVLEYNMQKTSQGVECDITAMICTLNTTRPSSGHFNGEN